MLGTVGTLGILARILGKFERFSRVPKNAIGTLERGRRSEVKSQESGVRSQESGVRSQESGVRSQESGVRSQESGVRKLNANENYLANLAEQSMRLEMKALRTSILVRQLADQFGLTWRS